MSLALVVVVRSTNIVMVNSENCVIYLLSKAFVANASKALLFREIEE